MSKLLSQDEATEKTNEVGIKLVGPYSGSDTKTEFECPYCSALFLAKPITVWRKRKKSCGCQNNVKDISKQRAIEKALQIGIKFVTDFRDNYTRVETICIICNKKTRCLPVDMWQSKTFCCINRTALVDKYLTKDNLEKYLPNYSANYIATKLFAPDFITTAGVVIDRARAFGVATHTVKDGNRLPTTVSQRKNTCLKKYGVSNPSQTEEVKRQKINKALEKYGVENVFQAEEIKEKSKQTCLEKYGVEFIGYLQSKPKSKFQIKIENILLKNNIDFEAEVGCLCKSYNDYFHRVYSPIVDIFIKKYNLVIECNGDFWHANPKFYDKSDTFNCYGGKISSTQIWERDASRTKQIESFGYKVLVIWEDEYNTSVEHVERKILDEITNSKNQTNNKANQPS